MVLSRFSSIFSACTGTYALLCLVGCVSAVDPNAVNYRSQQDSKPNATLRLPPDMIGSAPANTVRDAEDVDMSASGIRTAPSALSDPYTTTKTFPVAVPQKTEHKAPAQYALERDGAQYWLVVKGQTPEALLPKIEQFWLEQGFELIHPKEDSAKSASQNAVIETQWREVSPSVRQTFIRGSLSKLLGNRYVTHQKNKYRTRVEARLGVSRMSSAQGAKVRNGHLDSPSTLIFISQTAVREVLTGSAAQTSRWELASHDPLWEAIYLQRLMQTLMRQTTSHSVPQDKKHAQANLASSAIANEGNTETAQAAIKPEKKTIASSSMSILDLNQSFAQAWFQTGLALEQLNFTVEDQDRAKGLYYVRYVDPMDQSIARQGFWGQLFHGRKEKKARAYAINVREVEEQHTQITVLTAAGEKDTSSQAKRILGLLHSVVHAPS